MEIFTSCFLGIVLLLHPFHLGMAVITTNPANLTTCEGSPAVFTCVINETVPINWLINGQQPLSSTTTPLTPGPGAQSTFSITATSQLNEASVQCYYSPSVLAPPVVSPPAYLSVQAPPSAPTNLTTTVLNDTSVLLAWRPPLGIQTYLTYVVLVTSRNGSVVYNVTVGELNVTISTDPCDQYEATVRAVLSSCVGNSTKKMLSGAQPFLVPDQNTTLYGNSSNDPVNTTITLQYRTRVCNYTAIAVAENGFRQSKSDPSLIPSHMTSVTFSLPQKKHFNCTIIAYNAYGSNSTNISISTFSVIDITNDTGLNCLYSPHFLAAGCLLNVTSLTTGAKQCIVVQRQPNVSLDIPSCSSIKSLSAGVYFVEAFDIINKTAVSDVPAVSKVVTLSSPQPTDQPTSTSSSQDIGLIVVVIGGVVIIALVIGIAFMVIRHRAKIHMVKRHREEKNMVKGPMTYHTAETVQGSRRVEADGSEDAHNPFDAENKYAMIQLSGKRPIPTPSGGDAVTYSSVVCN